MQERRGEADRRAVQAPWGMGGMGACRSAEAFTGANTAPLGNKRRFGQNYDQDAGAGREGVEAYSGNDFGGNGAGELYGAAGGYVGYKGGVGMNSHHPLTGPGGYGGYSAQLGNSDAGQYDGSRGRSRSPDAKKEQPADDGGKRKKRSRWGGETEKVVIPGMPTALPTGMSKEQLDSYLAHIRLEEIGKKLRTGDVVPPDGKRSPSPEPVYNSQGVRVNTREFRYRKKLEDERHKIIDEQMKRDPTFRPPADYKKPTKTSEKIFIPVKEFPDINFIGLLIGPRGNTLKKMEADSGTKISIRGKGSVKEGKGPSSGPHPTEDEDLHCVVAADNEEKIAKAIKLIRKVIDTASTLPEGQNELKRSQLRELAALNGTLRDDEGQTCQNCGAVGHRKYDCPERSNLTNTLICRHCGGAGHVARDCTMRYSGGGTAYHRGGGGGGGGGPDSELDSEYANLMKELGENPGEVRGRASGGHYGPRTGDAGSAPPWANRGGNEGVSRPMGTGAPAPWLKGGSAPITSDPPRGPWGSRGGPPQDQHVGGYPGSGHGYQGSPPGGGGYGSYAGYPADYNQQQQQQQTYAQQPAANYGGAPAYGVEYGSYGGYGYDAYGGYQAQMGQQWGQQPLPPSTAPPPPPPSAAPPPPPPPTA